MNNRRFRWGIREKLTLLFFTVTLIAVTVNFLIVVPRLEMRMRNDRVKTMADTVQRLHEGAQMTFQQSDPYLVGPAVGGAWDEIFKGTTNRVAILRHAVDRANPLWSFDRFYVVWDQTGETMAGSGEAIEDPIAARAVRTGKLARGFSSFGTGLHAEAAMPLYDAVGVARGAIVSTTSLTGVTEIVQQVARRQLLSAIVALTIALLAGMLASSYMARRLRRLENAAKDVAAGNFKEPLVVDSEDEIGQLTRAFNQMQDRLGRADQARKAFIANASHELRTPLFSLSGYVELMREENLDEETQREFLDHMHRQIDRMTRLATDLLDLSRIDSGSLSIQPREVDLAGLAKSIAFDFSLQAEKHESEIVVEAGDQTVAICDPDRVAQILRILIGNSLKHTPEGTHVSIEVDGSKQGVTLTVDDDGPGIAPEDVGRIFDRFHTGDKTGGTGLGLAIAREIAVAMKGSLELVPTESGTTFRLRLPAGVRVDQPA
jgi:signal transduction histidine kinase